MTFRDRPRFSIARSPWRSEVSSSPTMKATPTWRWASSTSIGDRSIWRCDIWSAPLRSTRPTRGTRPISATFSAISAAPKRGLSGCGALGAQTRISGLRGIGRRSASPNSCCVATRMPWRISIEAHRGGSDMLAVMAGCCAKLGLADRARELVERCPDHPARSHRRQAGGQDRSSRMRSDSEHLAECLRLAGLPE